MAKVWFTAEEEVKCNLHMVKKHSEDFGSFFEGLVGRMSGITAVELLVNKEDEVVLKTNEGLMIRTNLKREEVPEKLVLEFDEEYVAGKATTVNSHYQHEFVSTEDGFVHRLTISDFKATGILGFFLKTFGAKNIGRDVLKAVKAFLLTHDRFPKQ